MVLWFGVFGIIELDTSEEQSNKYLSDILVVIVRWYNAIQSTKPD